MPACQQASVISSVFLGLCSLYRAGVLTLYTIHLFSMILMNSVWKEMLDVHQSSANEADETEAYSHRAFHIGSNYTQPQLLFFLCLNATFCIRAGWMLDSATLTVPSLVQSLVIPFHNSSGFESFCVCRGLWRVVTGCAFVQASQTEVHPAMFKSQGQCLRFW